MWTFLLQVLFLFQILIIQELKVKTESIQTNFNISFSAGLVLFRLVTTTGSDPRTIWNISRWPPPPFLSSDILMTNKCSSCKWNLCTKHEPISHYDDDGISSSGWDALATCAVVAFRLKIQLNLPVTFFWGDFLTWFFFQIDLCVFKCVFSNFELWTLSTTRSSPFCGKE